MDEDKLPRHAALRDYLQAHPVEGYDHRLVVDRSDGLGPRAVGWPEGLTPPDSATIDAWVSQQKAAEDQRLAARASRRALLRTSLNNWDTLTAAQQSTVIRNTFPALVRELRELLGEEP